MRWALFDTGFAASAVLVIVALLRANPAAAQDPDPVVELSVSPAVVSVGEPVSLSVSVYVPTWFVRPPLFPSFEIPNAILRKPRVASRPSSKRIGGDTWSGTTRRFTIYPLVAAAYRLESQAIELLIARPGKDPRAARVDSGEVRFEARVPPGAERLDPYLSGTRFDLDRSVDGDPETLKVGDALVLTYSAELEGLPAVFIPEIVADYDVPGLSVYAEQPKIEEGPLARRREKLTVIVNAGGSFTLPAVAIDWWDTVSGSIKTASLPELQLHVSGLAPASAEEGNRFALGPGLLVAVVVLLALALGLGPKAAAGLREFVRERRRRRRHSERFAWEQAERALEGSDAAAAHRALVRWIKRLDGVGDLRTLASRYDTDTLVADLARLNRYLYGGGDEEPDLHRLRENIAAARQRALSESRSEAGALPALNP
ncbi:MAG: hypothetical protein AAGI72_21600 [Pseudomonadota bacterium]